MSVHSLGDYEADARELLPGPVRRARAIFSQLETHPIFGHPQFQQTFLSDIPRMVRRLVAVYHFFDSVDVSCIVVGTTELLEERILAVVAAEKGIPSICMQHGVVMGEPSFMPVFAAKQGVYGHYEAEWYRRRGVSEDRVEIIGHPRFDSIFTRTAKTRQEVERILGLDPEKKSVLIATQPEDLFWTQFIELLLSRSLLQVIIKPHPTEVVAGSVGQYEALCSRYSSAKLIRRTGDPLTKAFGFEVDLYDAIPNVDLLVTSSSTVGLEAMLFGKPTFFLHSLGDYYDKARLGDAVHRDASKLVTFILHFLQDASVQTYVEGKRKEFLAYAYPQQLSSDRLKSLIERITGCI